MNIQNKIDLFVKENGIYPEAFHICPRFEKCNINRCPLHKDYLKLETAEEDKEKKCKLAKSIRHLIGIHFKLKNEGLTEKELSGKRVWEKLTQEQRENRIKTLQQAAVLFKKGDILPCKGIKKKIGVANELKIENRGI